MVAQSKVFTADAEGAEKKILVCSGSTGTNESLQPLAGHFLAEGLGFMENRYLPILHNTISLCDLGGSAVKQNGFF
jgi:hypothetical protein